MTLDAFLEKIFRPAHPVEVAISGIAILGILFGAAHLVRQRASRELGIQSKLAFVLDQTATARERTVSLEMLKDRDLEQLKAGMGGHAISQKSLYESGLSLQEERRLLEKQLEIMSKYLAINPSLSRIFIMRDDQALESYLTSYFPLKAFGGAAVNLPAVVRITSKERFAHPERGKSDSVNGRLQWVPPQVGTSVRSNALGEYVMFTNSGLILHGPPLNAEDHERFPHICLGLDRQAARKLYRASFIGTKISLEHIAVEKVAPPAPVQIVTPSQISASSETLAPDTTIHAPVEP